MIKQIAIGACAGTLLLAGCGGDDGDDSGEPAAPTSPATSAQTQPEPTAPAAKGTTIETGDSQYGQVLFDGDDQAIYYFDKETESKSECYGACAEAWPPVLSKGEPQAGAGIQQGLLGTTQRDDGTTQVTYDGHPLYLYAHEGPNEVTCHDVREFGGLWLAVKPNGQAVS